MPCKVIPVGDTYAIACSRGRSAPCSTPHCGRPHTALCDFLVVRNGKPGTCDAKLCASCRVRQPGKDKDFCRAHAGAGA